IAASPPERMLAPKRISSLPRRGKAGRPSGELVEAPPLVPLHDPIVCHCMLIARSELITVVEHGCQTVRSLSMHTGAGTVWGGCLPRLVELTAETLWQTVRCIEVIDRTPWVKSFRFEVPSGHCTESVKPGQRIVVQARIDGANIERAYTLTSPAPKSAYYEIT